MGSDSDFPVLVPAIKRLKGMGIETEVRVMSAHRTPAAAAAFSESARENGFGVYCSCRKSGTFGWSAGQHIPLCR